MSDNLYFKYSEAATLVKKYEELYNKISEDGELDEETEILLYQIEDDISILLWELLQIIDNFGIEKGQNKERIKNLERINISIDKQTEFLKKFVQNIVKKQGVINKNNNLNTRVGERSVTVVKSKIYNVSDDFDNPKYTRYNLKKIPAEHIARVNKFFSDRGIELDKEKIILKSEINSDIKNGAIIEGVEEETKEYITIK